MDDELKQVQDLRKTTRCGWKMCQFAVRSSNTFEGRIAYLKENGWKSRSVVCGNLLLVLDWKD